MVKAKSRVFKEFEGGEGETGVVREKSRVVILKSRVVKSKSRVGKEFEGGEGKIKGVEGKIKGGVGEIEGGLGIKG